MVLNVASRSAGLEQQVEAVAVDELERPVRGLGLRTAISVVPGVPDGIGGAGRPDTVNSTDGYRPGWSPSDTKKAEVLVSSEEIGLSWTRLELYLVEVGGIEPPSEGTPCPALHA